MQEREESFWGKAWRMLESLWSRPKKEKPHLEQTPTPGIIPTAKEDERESFINKEGELLTCLSANGQFVPERDPEPVRRPENTHHSF